MDAMTVFRTFDQVEAQVIRSRLEAAGFHPEVIHEIASAVAPGPISTGGIRVQVPEGEAQFALELIQSEPDKTP